MTKLSSVGLLSLVGISLVAGDNYSCDQMKKLSQEYFPESVSNNMICLSFHSNGWNSISNNKNSIGLWNIRKDFCNSLCSSICKNPKDLFKPEINAQCAEMVYTEFGYNHWDAWNKGKCNGWNKCGINTSDNDEVNAAITGTGDGSCTDCGLKAALTGSGGSGGDDVVKAALTGSGGDIVKAALTGSGGSGGDDDVNAAITGSGDGTCTDCGVKAAITGSGGVTGSGTTIPVKSEIFSATGDSNIPVMVETFSATGDSNIPVMVETFSATGDSTIPVMVEIFSATGDSNIPV
ncbi:hypothetical protein ACTA71_002646 [Dictyostelium dimigraforme]